MERSTCRICRRNELNLIIDLFSGEKESKDILNKIFMCFQIIITYEKYLPRMICGECYKELNSANQFRLKCISFEQIFSDVLIKNSENETNNLSPEAFAGETEPTTDIENSNKVIVSNEKSKPFKVQCDICKKILKTELSLEKHTVNMHKKRKHIGKITGHGANRRYNCTDCEYSTPHSQTLVNHMRRHNGDRPFKCECGKTFTQSSSLTAHQKTHSDTTYYTCSTCGKQFKHLFTLKKHLFVHEPKDFTCSVCHKVLRSKQTLQDHMHRHLNVKNYNCEDCGDTFFTSSELLSHKKKHAIVKSVECHLCEYKTNDKKYFTIHLKRHTGEKTHKCELCHFSFYTKVDLRRHMRIHTKMKPYSCPTCSQRFAHSTSLNKHILTVHGLSRKWQDFKNKQK